MDKPKCWVKNGF